MTNTIALPCSIPVFKTLMLILVNSQNQWNVKKTRQGMEMIWKQITITMHTWCMGQNGQAATACLRSDVKLPDPQLNPKNSMEWRSWFSVKNRLSAPTDHTSILKMKAQIALTQSWPWRLHTLEKKKSYSSTVCSAFIPRNKIQQVLTMNLAQLQPLNSWAQKHGFWHQTSKKFAMVHGVERKNWWKNFDSQQKFLLNDSNTKDISVGNTRQFSCYIHGHSVKGFGWAVCYKNVNVTSRVIKSEIQNADFISPDQAMSCTHLFHFGTL